MTHGRKSKNREQLNSGQTFPGSARIPENKMVPTVVREVSRQLAELRRAAVGAQLMVQSDKGGSWNSMFIEFMEWR